MFYDFDKLMEVFAKVRELDVIVMDNENRMSKIADSIASIDGRVKFDEEKILICY